MTRSRFAGWNLAFLAIMALGFAAAIYHATSGRWGNAIIAAAKPSAIIARKARFQPASRDRVMESLPVWRWS